MNIKKFLLSIAIVVIAILLIMAIRSTSNNDTSTIPEETDVEQPNDDLSQDDETDGSGSPAAPTTSVVSLALLADPSAKPQRGCDDVVMVSRSIEPTAMPLTRAIELLFETDESTINGNRHFIPNTARTLKFDRASVVNGTANIYLTGELSGLMGVCDTPRAAIQIEETALQFATVNNVQLYLNGEPTDLIPSER